jgi:hypothetical protein
MHTRKTSTSHTASHSCSATIPEVGACKQAHQRWLGMARDALECSLPLCSVNLCLEAAITCAKSRCWLLCSQPSRQRLKLKKLSIVVATAAAVSHAHACSVKKGLSGPHRPAADKVFGALASFTWQCHTVSKGSACIAGQKHLAR